MCIPLFLAVNWMHHILFNFSVSVYAMESDRYFIDRIWINSCYIPIQFGDSVWFTGIRFIEWKWQSKFVATTMNYACVCECVCVYKTLISDVVLLFAHQKRGMKRSRLPNNKTYSFLSTKRNNLSIGTDQQKNKLKRRKRREKWEREGKIRVKQKLILTHEQQCVHLACFHAYTFTLIWSTVLLNTFQFEIHCEFNVFH